MKIAIASGKGGTGKTFLSTNLFFALQQRGLKPTIVDCDAEAPNAALFFQGKPAFIRHVMLRVPTIDTAKCNFCGKCKSFCHYNAVFVLPSAGVARVMEELCHGCGGCLWLCDQGAVSEKSLQLGQVFAYSTKEGGMVISAQMQVGIHSPVKVIQAGVKEAFDHSVVIFDAPPGTSCPFIHTVSSADYVLLVTEPTPFGLSDLKQSVEVLKTLNIPHGVVINRQGLGEETALRCYLKEMNIPVLLEVPFNRDIATHYSTGRLWAASHSQWAEMLCQMYFKIEKWNGSCHR